MEHYIKISDDCRLWIEQETLHLKVVDSFGDPVELTEVEAVRLANALLELVKVAKR